MPTHEQFMQRAIELAERASGNTSPNPLVGAVIVQNDEIIGEGWHKRAGGPHAEVDAINNARKNYNDLSDTTLYVSLEPCSHHGKTPPCTQAILDAGIPNVVYASADTNDTAAGGGTVLANAGVHVTANVREKEANYTNRFFFHYQKHRTPFVIAKFASSLDGRTASRTGNSKWITGEAARQRGHTARQAVDVIIVGALTAIADNPQLNVRNTDAHPYTDASHPVRILLDSRGRVPLSNALFDAALPGKTIVATTDAMPSDHRQQLNNKGVETLTLPCNQITNRPDLHALMHKLGERQVQSVLIEGGNSVLGSFFDAGLVNEVWAFIAPMIIGGENAAPSVGGLGVDFLNDAHRLTDVNVEYLSGDFLLKGRVATPNPPSATGVC